MTPKPVQWRVARPNGVLTARVTHAVPFEARRAVCGLWPKHGWQDCSAALKHCKRCSQVLARRERAA